MTGTRKKTVGQRCSVHIYHYRSISSFREQQRQQLNLQNLLVCAAAKYDSLSKVGRTYHTLYTMRSRTFSGGSETSSTVVEWAMLKMTMASSADSEGPWFLPDILVNVRKSGDETLGVIQEVLSDGSCKVALGSNRSGNTVIALPSEMEIIPPRKSDKIKIMGCSLRGFTGKLIGVDATDDI
ncbi:hypothetical protein PTKIN_Ptkin13bG0188900 [Pterospermum kingtungense]